MFRLNTSQRPQTTQWRETGGCICRLKRPLLQNIRLTCPILPQVRILGVHCSPKFATRSCFDVIDCNDCKSLSENCCSFARDRLLAKMRSFLLQGTRKLQCVVSSSILDHSVEVKRFTHLLHRIWSVPEVALTFGRESFNIGAIGTYRSAGYTRFSKPVLPLGLRQLSPLPTSPTT